MPRLTRIPHMPTAADGQPLKRAIRRAAQELDLSEYVVAEALSHLLEQVAVEVAAGECVTIPGFGRFGAGIITKENHGEMVFPMFFPSRALRNEVRAVLTVERARSSNARMQSYRNSHAAGSRKGDRSRVFTAQRAFREVLRAEESKRGGRARD